MTAIICGSGGPPAAALVNGLDIGNGLHVDLGAMRGLNLVVAKRLVTAFGR